MYLRNRECGAFKEKFHLLGSQSGRIYNITYVLDMSQKLNYSYDYDITLEETSCSCNPSAVETNGSSVKQQEAKRQKLDESSLLPMSQCQNVPPVRIWLEYEEINSTTNEELQYEEETNQWKFDSFCRRKPLGITLFMDFGSKEVGEKKIINGLVGMFFAQTFCDVQFQFKEGQSVGAHVVILSASSPVFSAMFQSGLSESQSQTVVIDDIEREVFRQMLIYLYTGRAPKLTEESITQLLFVASDKYGVEALKNECVNALKKELKINNAISFLVWAKFYSVPKLFNKAMKFVLQNCSKLSRQPEWMELIKNHPELCLEVTQRIIDYLK